MPDSEFLTIGEVAMLIRRSTDFVRTAIANGYLKAQPVGRTHNITRTAYDEWLAQGAISAQAKDRKSA